MLSLPASHLHQELGFLHYLRRAGVPVSEYSFPPNKIAPLTAEIYSTELQCSAETSRTQRSTMNAAVNGDRGLEPGDERYRNTEGDDGMAAIVLPLQPLLLLMSANANRWQCCCFYLLIILMGVMTAMRQSIFGNETR